MTKLDFTQFFGILGEAKFASLRLYDGTNPKVIGYQDRIYFKDNVTVWFMGNCKNPDGDIVVKQYQNSIIPQQITAKGQCLQTQLFHNMDDDEYMLIINKLVELGAVDASKI